MRKHIRRNGRACEFESLEGRLLMSGDTVLEWNRIMCDAAAIDHGIGAPGLNVGPTRASRAMAIESVAVFDAVNAIDGSYTPYMVTDVHASKGASIDAAAAQAAHDTLLALYPYLKPMFDAKLAADLASIPSGLARQGSDIGAKVAKEVLAARANDGSQLDAPGRPVNYVYGQMPGQWRPDPLHPDAAPLGVNWGQVTPFAIPSAADFSAPPPPDLTSKEYADAYMQVMAIGGKDSTVRTEEQTEIGIFWGYDAQPGLCAPVRFYNQIADVLAVQQHNTEVQNARYFALINTAMADAAITCWGNKFKYDFWRPVTAIRENDPGTGPSGLGSGNPYLVGQGDPNWEPFGAPADNGTGTNFTPPFPSYTSGHATIGGALFEVLKDFYGTDNIHFTIESDEFNTITVDQNGVARPLMPRSYDSFSQAALENGMSRIYLGIHFSFDMEQGLICGDHIGDYVFSHELLPARKGNGKGNTAAVASTPFSSTVIASSQNSTASSGQTVLDQTLGKKGNSHDVIAAV